MFNNLFTLRGTLSDKQHLTLLIFGLVFILGGWSIASLFITGGLLPSPLMVIQSVPELHFKDAMLRNLFYSLTLLIY